MPVPSPITMAEPASYFGDTETGGPAGPNDSAQIMAEAQSRQKQFDVVSGLHQKYGAYINAFKQANVLPPDATPDEISDAMAFYAKARGKSDQEASTHAARARMVASAPADQQALADNTPAALESRRRNVLGPYVAPAIGAARDIGLGTVYGVDQGVSGVGNLLGVDTQENDQYRNERAAELQNQTTIPGAPMAGQFAPYILAGATTGPIGMGALMGGQGANRVKQAGGDYGQMAAYAAGQAALGTVLPAGLGRVGGGMAAPLTVMGEAAGAGPAMASKIVQATTAGTGAGAGLGAANIISADMTGVPRGNTLQEIIEPALTLGALGGGHGALRAGRTLLQDRAEAKDIAEQASAMAAQQKIQMQQEKLDELHQIAMDYGRAEMAPAAAPSLKMAEDLGATARPDVRQYLDTQEQMAPQREALARTPATLETQNLRNAMLPQELLARKQAAPFSDVAPPVVAEDIAFKNEARKNVAEDIGRGQFDRNVMEQEQARLDKEVADSEALARIRAKNELLQKVGQNKTAENLYAQEQSRTARDADTQAEMDLIREKEAQNVQGATAGAKANAELSIEQIARQTGQSHADLLAEYRAKQVDVRQSARDTGAQLTDTEVHKIALSEMLPKRQSQLPTEAAPVRQTEGTPEPQADVPQFEKGPDVTPGEALVPNLPPRPENVSTAPQPVAPLRGSGGNAPMGEGEAPAGASPVAKSKQARVTAAKWNYGQKLITKAELNAQLKAIYNEPTPEVSRAIPAQEIRPQTSPPRRDVGADTRPGVDRSIRVGRSSGSRDAEGQREAPRQEESQGENKSGSTQEPVEGRRDQVPQSEVAPLRKKGRDVTMRSGLTNEDITAIAKGSVSAAKYVGARVSSAAKRIAPTMQRIVDAAGYYTYSDAEARLRFRHLDDLADKVHEISNYANEITHQAAPEINKINNAVVLRPTELPSYIREQSVSVPKGATGGFNSLMYDVQNGKKPLSALSESSQRMVQGQWDANKLTAEQFKDAGLTKVSGAAFKSFPDGVGLVRSPHQQMNWLVSGQYGSSARDAFFKEIVDTNPGETMSSVKKYYESTISEGGSSRRDPMELFRRFPNVPSHFAYKGKVFRIIDNDPAAYTRRIIDNSTGRIAFAKVMGQAYDQTKALSEMGIEVPGHKVPMVHNVFRNIHGMRTPFLPMLTDNPIGNQVARYANILGAAARTSSLIKSGVGTAADVAGWTTRGVTNTGTTTPSATVRSLVRVLGDGLRVRGKESREESRTRLEKYGVLPDHVLNWVDPRGVPETLAQAFRNVTGVLGAWRMQYVQAAHAGVNYAMDLQSGKVKGDYESRRLQSLGFSAAEAGAMSSGKGTDAQYAELVKRVASHATGEQLRPEQQSVINQYALANKYGPAFTSYMDQQMREFGRLSKGLSEADSPAAVAKQASLLGGKITGAGISGAATVLAYNWIAGAVRGGLQGGSNQVAQETEDQKHFWRDVFWRSYVGGHLGSAIDVLAALYRHDDFSAKNALGSISYTGSKIADVAGATFDAMDQGSAEPYTDLVQRMTMTLSSGLEQNPNRRKAISSFYRFASENPGLVRTVSGSGGKNAVSVAIKKAVQAAKNADPSEFKEYLRKAFVEARLIGANEPNVSAAFRSRQMLPKTKGWNDTNEGAKALYRAIGPTAYKELEEQDKLLEWFSEEYK